MWDPEQLAEIAVRADALQAAGDPLGEWLALRERSELGGLELAERQSLRRRARRLRRTLESRLVLADDPVLGRPQIIRERGWISDLSLGSATRAALEAILARPDAAFVLGVRLGGTPAQLEACVEVLAAAPAGACVRQLALELDVDTEEPRREFVERIEARHIELGQRLPELVLLEVDGASVPLEADVGAGKAEAWSAVCRTALGRSLQSPDPQLRRDALHRLRDHGDAVAQLRSSLLRIIEDDPERRVRAAAFALVPQLGPASEAVFAILVDSARRRDDATLLDWLARIGRD